MRLVSTLVMAFALSSSACATSLDALVERGRYHEACEVADDYAPKLVDALAIQATVTITSWSVNDTLREAAITTAPHDASWRAVAIELSLGQPPAELVELNVTAPIVRGDGWHSRGGVGVGDAYRIMTGKAAPAPRPQLTFDDLVAGARDAVLLGDDGGLRRIREALGPDHRPEDLALGERLSAVFSSSCYVTAGTSCRVVTMVAPHPEQTVGAPAAAFTLRYALADPESGAYCTQMEHIEIPLTSGADAPTQLASTFPGKTQSLAELRATARVHGTPSESPFYPDEG